MRIYFGRKALSREIVAPARIRLAKIRAKVKSNCPTWIDANQKCRARSRPFSRMLASKSLTHRLIRASIWARPQATTRLLVRFNTINFYWAALSASQTFVRVQPISGSLQRLKQARLSPSFNQRGKSRWQKNWMVALPSKSASKWHLRKQNLSRCSRTNSKMTKLSSKSCQAITATNNQWTCKCHSNKR